MSTQTGDHFHCPVDRICVVMFSDLYFLYARFIIVV